MERRGRKKIRIGRMAKDYRRKEGRKYRCKRTKGEEEHGCTLRTERNHISQE
jgi:hypothetical protein